MTRFRDVVWQVILPAALIAAASLYEGYRIGARELANVKNERDVAMEHATLLAKQRENYRGELLRLRKAVDDACACGRTMGDGSREVLVGETWIKIGK